MASFEGDDTVRCLVDQLQGPCAEEDVQWMLDEQEQAATEAIPITVEVRIRDGSALRPEVIKDAVERLLQEKVSFTYADGSVDLSCEDAAISAMLKQHVLCAAMVDTNPTLCRIGTLLMTWQCQLHVHVYQAHDEEAAEDDEGEDGVPSYKEWLLPCAQLEGAWSTLYYDSAVKQQLLQYAASALLFAEARVDPHLVSWNRVVLLHGPPGTGKTSLCKALAQKLAIRFSHRYRAASLVEVNAHSLFSKWFSESGKTVSKLFTKIKELLEEPDMLVFVLIDEVESLAAARKASGGSEPSDAVRAVNALLTQIDSLKCFPNTMVLTTSNITDAIDVAFVDRADIKAYIGPPTLAARYEMLRTSLQELSRAGVIQGSAATLLWPYHRLQEHVLGLAPQPGSTISHSKVPSASATAPHVHDAHARGGVTFNLPLKQPVLLSKTSGCTATGVACMRLTPAVQLLLTQQPQHDEHAALSCSGLLLLAAQQCDGLSGRSLRKLPFLAHARYDGSLPLPCPLKQYIHAVQQAVHAEQTDRQDLGSAARNMHQATTMM